MARYQLRRPSPVTIFPRRVRRDVAAISSSVAMKEEEPESPGSPLSSPSSAGSQSSDSESDSDDEEHAKMKDEKKQQQQKLASSSDAAASTASSSRAVQTLGPDPTVASSQMPLASLLSMMNASANTSSIPQITEIKSQTERKAQSTPTSTAPAPPPFLGTTARAGQTAPSSIPQETLPQEPEQRPIMTNEARIAAVVLGVLGILALVVCGLILLKRRKRRGRENYVPRDPDAFNPSNTNSAIAPEIVNVPDTAHTGAASSVFARLNGGTSGGGDGHITRSTDRSNTLFGGGSYARPETVSTNRSMSRIPPQTPNPFADPPLNKAYDVLNNRPRSTTLTDRGSWMNNPFKNPESERFDPFGELKDKARRERLRYLQEAKREAELQRQMEQKEAMGLRPDGMPLDQSGYR
ncbi:hypothetical protein PTNB73_01699 [Pyrenophora teres f. teres]|nr:hypothetical protein HRS9139_00286 [Pyrenophora teres f. teres]KAE8847858.1 hypothetical protein PTNB85_01701 [Pyrenophora teres f. teres]KAE8853983.1 hypothetical protein HRS9122_00975 [Pyrenophora teres f. teres]KAE8867785.1 hypothetical protein PTNB29_01696 [Pyrenophora teres f. teres]KAE8872548.1 hypothetical protein PTNB73_01699 [Pyrenophora teres f. teres]